MNKSVSLRFFAIPTPATTLYNRISPNAYVSATPWRIDPAQSKGTTSRRHQLAVHVHTHTHIDREEPITAR